MSDLLLLALFPLLMAYAAASDLLSMTISNKVCLLLLVGFGIATAAGPSWSDRSGHVAAGFLLVLLVTFAMFAARLDRRRRRQARGGHLALARLGLQLESASGRHCSAALSPLFCRSSGLFRFPTFVAAGLAAEAPRTNAGVPYGIALAGAALVVYPDRRSGAAFNVRLKADTVRRYRFSRLGYVQLTIS